jgi:hypothetical protein
MRHLVPTRPAALLAAGRLERNVEPELRGRHFGRDSSSTWVLTNPR